jgi:uncharacterized membrane protein YgdD (TMEM256/DUF423 family)
MERVFFLFGTIFAFVGVAAGAFGAHALQARLAPERLSTFEVAVRYQMYHALALLAVSWAAGRWPGGGVHAAGWLFVVGILVFSGTVYGLALGGPRWLGAITPIGGLCFLTGWVLLAWNAFRS